MSRRSKRKIQNRAKQDDAADGDGQQQTLPATTTATANPAPAKNWIVPGICILLAAMVWVVFGQVAGFEFVNYDDPDNVAGNAHIAAGLSWGGISWAFTHNLVGRWAPLVTILHMAVCQFFGVQPAAHHLTNVLLHGAGAIVLFLALRQMTGTLWRSAFVAAVFAIHPLRAEAVGWVSDCGDPLGGLFFMLTLLAYARYAQGPASRARYFAVVALFAMGLMSKPVLVTLPFVLLLLDYWPLRRFPKGPGQEKRFSFQGISWWKRFPC